MPKSRVRKQPVTLAPYNYPGNAKSATGHHLIRKFHVLLKLQDQLLTGSASTSHKLEDVQKEIQSLGGLDVYQRISARGQSEARGGGSEKIFVEWLRTMGQISRQSKRHGKEKLELLEVGAVKPDNYAPYATWIECTPIDLHPRHPLILEQDFLKMSEPENRSKWDAISLSLVINFVPNLRDRGRMLSLAHSFLRDEGYLFLALPLPCVANSRYFSFDHLKRLMSAVGFRTTKERWKTGGRMGYWLYQKISEPPALGENLQQPFEKKALLREGKGRNNFAILLNKLHVDDDLSENVAEIGYA